MFFFVTCSVTPPLGALERSPNSQLKNFACCPKAHQEPGAQGSQGYWKEKTTFFHHITHIFGVLESQNESLYFISTMYIQSFVISE